MKRLAPFFFALNPILWASFYSIGRDALKSINPIVFATAEITVAALPGLFILIFLGSTLRWNLVRSGILLGSVLYSGVFASTWALNFTSATDTGFYPALNGVFATLIAWAFLRKPIDRVTWVAGIVSIIGVALLVYQASHDDQSLIGEVIALAAALIYTVYIFTADRETEGDGSGLWLVFAVELVVMAVLSIALAAITGHLTGADWHEAARVRTLIVYAGLATTFVPTAISIFFQRYANPVTVAYLYVLEPVWSALIALYWLSERISPLAYVGGGFIIAGSLIKNLLPVSKTDEKAPAS